MAEAGRTFTKKTSMIITATILKEAVKRWLKGNFKLLLKLRFWNLVTDWSILIPTNDIDVVLNRRCLPKWNLGTDWSILIPTNDIDVVLNRRCLPKWANWNLVADWSILIPTNDIDVAKMGN